MSDEVPERELPQVIYGMLLSGGRITRLFSCPCPTDMWPLVFSPQPGAKIEMAGQSETQITIQNTGMLPAAYMVAFVSRETMAKMAAAKNVFDAVQNAYGAFKKPPADKN